MREMMRMIRRGKRENRESDGGECERREKYVYMYIKGNKFKRMSVYLLCFVCEFVFLSVFNDEYDVRQVFNWFDEYLHLILKKDVLINSSADKWVKNRLCLN